MYTIQIPGYNGVESAYKFIELAEETLEEYGFMSIAEVHDYFWHDDVTLTSVRGGRYNLKDTLDIGWSTKFTTKVFGDDNLGWTIEINDPKTFAVDMEWSIRGRLVNTLDLPDDGIIQISYGLNNGYEKDVAIVNIKNTTKLKMINVLEGDDATKALSNLLPNNTKLGIKLSDEQEGKIARAKYRKLVLEKLAKVTEDDDDMYSIIFSDAVNSFDDLLEVIENKIGGKKNESTIN